MAETFSNNNYKNVLQKPNLQLHNDIVTRLDRFLHSGKVPNLLFMVHRVAEKGLL